MMMSFFHKLGHNCVSPPPLHLALFENQNISTPVILFAVLQVTHSSPVLMGTHTQWECYFFQDPLNL